MPQYDVISPVNHDGKKYLPGSVIELSEEKARELLKSNVLAEKSSSEKEPSEKRKR